MANPIVTIQMKDGGGQSVATSSSLLSPLPLPLVLSLLCGVFSSTAPRLYSRQIKIAPRSLSGFQGLYFGL